MPILPHHCLRCAQFLSYKKNKECRTCIQNPTPITVTHACFPYIAPITQLIISLKFQHQLSYARALGELLAQHIRIQYQQKPLPDLIIPVPLHKNRLSERGFNQALEIARPVAKALHIPLDYLSLKRKKPTIAQSGLLAAERKLNIANAFTATRYYHGLHIALVDDVITTGHTVNECCRVLKAHQAKQIDVWCCARRGEI